MFQVLLEFLGSVDDDWGELETQLNHLTQSIIYIANTVNDGVLERNCGDYDKRR